LENKLDTIENSLTNLINIPKSGDAWFENKSNMYKFHLIKSNSAPQKPNIDSKDIVASYTDNNYFKDLVTPKLYLKMNIKNLTNNIEKMFVRKYTLSASIFNTVSSSNIKTNDELLAHLYTYVRGNDYDYYDSIIDLPIRKETYNSQFNIMDIPTMLSGNPWSEINDNNKENLNYKITLDTIEYKHQEDSSIRFKIKIGDYLALNNTNNIYLVKSVNPSTNEIIIEEYIGHAHIQTFAENQNMFFTIYENDFSCTHDNLHDLFCEHIHGGERNVLFCDMDCGSSFFRDIIFSCRKWTVAESTDSTQGIKLWPYCTGAGGVDYMLRCNGKPLWG
jgi:hypothetical protein